MTKTKQKQKKNINETEEKMPESPNDQNPQIAGQVIIKKKEKVSTTELPETEKKELSGFDMNEFVASPLESGLVVKREVTTIPARKPNSQQFFRIHPSEEVTVNVINWEEDGTLYLVRKDALPYLFGLTKVVKLYLGMLYTGNPFLYPVQQPDDKGVWNQWHRSQSKIVLQAKEQWVRAQPERSINGYVAYIAEGKLPDPEWPDKTMAEILSTAFADAIINSADHPIVKSVKGMA